MGCVELESLLLMVLTGYQIGKACDEQTKALGQLTDDLSAK